MRIQTAAAGVFFALGVLLPRAEPAIAAGIERELPVPRHTIYPGDLIAAESIVDRRFIASSVTRAPIHESHASLIGKVARRTLVAGQPVAIGAVRDPDVVAQGRATILVLQSGGLTITSSGIPLQSGGAGDVISIRNQDSGAIVKGVVQADGTIRVGLQ